MCKYKYRILGHDGTAVEKKIKNEMIDEVEEIFRRVSGSEHHKASVIWKDP